MILHIYIYIYIYMLYHFEIVHYRKKRSKRIRRRIYLNWISPYMNCSFHSQNLILTFIDACRIRKWLIYLLRRIITISMVYSYSVLSLLRGMNKQSQKTIPLVMMTNKCFPLLTSKMMSILIYKLLGNDFVILHMFEGKYTLN